MINNKETIAFLEKNIKSLLQVAVNNNLLKTGCSVECKPATWINLYPKKKDRCLALLYKGLNKILPRIFPKTFSLQEEQKAPRLVRWFPFKETPLITEDGVSVQRTFTISFADKNTMLSDISFSPITPMEYIKLNFTLKDSILNDNLWTRLKRKINSC